MKTKEQKRQEANQRQLGHMEKIQELGGLGYLQKRLDELDSKPGKCKAERVRIEKAISKLQEAEKNKNVAKMPTIEAPEKSIKKSKGGK